MLSRDRLRPASGGDPSLLVFTLPEHASSIADEVEIYAVPVEFRQGGMLLCVPPDIVSPQVIAEGQTGSEEALFGPNSFFEVGLVEEAEDLMSTIALGIQARVLVIDVHDEVLAFCREYDPVTDSLASIVGFSSDHPNSFA